jgi:transcriptional regulator with XRE-family HTH domain
MSEHQAPDYWSSLLKQIREVKNWTQSQLADELGVSRETVSRWEQERKYPSLENQICIGQLATSLNFMSIYGIAAVVTNSPFPMILTDRNDMVLAASKCSGFVAGMTVIEQTPEEERENYIQFSNMVWEAGFWDKADNLLEYDFEIDGQQRKAVIHSVGSRGHIFAVVQKR